MIEASFDRLSKRAAIDGAYQYDTGQRLRLSGLPSPDEMNEADDFLDGDLAAVQVQFSHEGDSQAEPRLAAWDDERGAWLCDLPDEYLSTTDPVNVYVYVSHGGDEYGSRNKTMYAGVFTPIGRAAPSGTATEDQLREWERVEAEVDLALASAEAAHNTALNEYNAASDGAQAAQEAAEAAQEAANAAGESAARLERLGLSLDSTTVVMVPLPAGAEATVSMQSETLTFGIPAGPQGEPGDPGEHGPTDIGLSITDGVLTITPR